MIVKNERHVIERCIRSVLPFITSWVIVDTGSTDGTQGLIRKLLSNKPGELHEREWVNFGHNRTEALELARGKADYILLIDADEELLYKPDFVMPKLTHDLYKTTHLSGNSSVTFFRPQLLKGNLPFVYKGVLHEYVDCAYPYTQSELLGIECKGYFDSFRNSNPKAKYLNDAKILEEALVSEPDNSRYVFYLAQSYRDAKVFDKAIENYNKRAYMGGWGEEVFYSLYQIAGLYEVTREEFSTILEAYLKAYNSRPTRAEPLVDLARLYRLRNEYNAASLFAQLAVKTKKPNDLLFLDESTYLWRAKDELSLALYYTGEYSKSFETMNELLNSKNLPDKEKSRIEKNIEFVKQKLYRK